MSSFGRVVLLGSSLALSGCNLFGHAQAGPVAPFANGVPHGGGEASYVGYLDVRAGETWAKCHLAIPAGSCEPPETARRAGASDGVYVRGSSLGFGVGMTPGIFVGATDAQKVFILDGAGRLGFETLHGTPYGSVGVQGALTGGIAVQKSYDPRALILCRSLTYLTASLQGSIDYLPAAGAKIPAVSLLFGVIGLDDGGAPSDRYVPGANCPR
jgi:hypothetical protein